MKKTMAVILSVILLAACGGEKRSDGNYALSEAEAEKVWLRVEAESAPWIEGNGGMANFRTTGVFKAVDMYRGEKNRYYAVTVEGDIDFYLNGEFDYENRGYKFSLTFHEFEKAPNGELNLVRKSPITDSSRPEWLGAYEEFIRAITADAGSYDPLLHIAEIGFYDFDGDGKKDVVYKDVYDTTSVFAGGKIVLKESGGSDIAFHGTVVDYGGGSWRGELYGQIFEIFKTHFK
ncbi:MAG: hypothetical protein LBI38_06270 [Oscillospiraceae bacterium]|jgi:hypothetical protein|nr:hypothetical protein [Oscillospiraceae bacterium]